MIKLEQIKMAVAELEPMEFAAFSQWFETLRQERWDRKIEADVQSGKLDQFAARAMADYRASKTKPH